MHFPRTSDQHRTIALRTEVIGVQATFEAALRLMEAGEFDQAVGALAVAKVLMRRAQRGDRAVNRPQLP